jgi:hypothetical protein
MNTDDIKEMIDDFLSLSDEEMERVINTTETFKPFRGMQLSFVKSLFNKIKNDDALIEEFLNVFEDKYGKQD